MQKGNFHIGTSGWHYKHWIGTFYPPDLKAKEMLKYYTQFFDTVEINNSFYRLPAPETFVNWRETVPSNFTFTVKVSRYITHMKKLKDTSDSLHQFLKNVNALGPKLGPLLFQLPPMWKFNEERLRDFIKTLSIGYRYTFEFRNAEWYNEKVYLLLAKHNIAICIYDLAGHHSPEKVTADFIYIRLHGPGEKYTGSYSEKALAGLAKRCIIWNEQGKDVYIYFDNDQFGYAAFNAQKLIDLV